MTIKEARNILRDHNYWRRGDDNFEMTDPRLLGLAIEKAVSLLTEMIK